VSSEEKRSSEKPAQRLDLYVIARIIVVLKEKGSINKTNLATTAGLAYDKLGKYISWMLEKKLINSDENGIITLTGEGTRSYEELVKWIMRYIGRVRFPKIS